MTSQYVILTLEAPMMSFGSDAVDNRRPTAVFPGRSMLTGLIGNALGWRRQDGRQLQELQERIRYAARMEHSDQGGVTIAQDFQTVELSRKDRLWTTSGVPERREGDATSPKMRELRYLEYVVESRAVVALRLEGPGEHPTLEEVGHSLQWPARPLHIGRKCCVPQGMIFAGFRDADTATQALMAEPSEWPANTFQWDPGEGDHNVRSDREYWTSDLKDWANRIHAGRRRVNEGAQIPPAQDE